MITIYQNPVIFIIFELGTSYKPKGLLILKKQDNKL